MELETRFAGIQFDSQLAALNFRVLSIDLAEGFTKEEAEAITSEIETLYPFQQASAESRDKLRFAVETAAKNFALIDAPELVFQLEEIAPDLLETSSDTAQLMIQLLGNRLLAHVDAPGSWTDAKGFMKETYERYRTYAERAKATGYPELHLAYEMLLNFVGKERPEQIMNLIEDARSLNVRDSENFVKLMMKLESGDVGITGAQRVATQTENFLCRYKDQSALLFDVAKDSGLQCP